MKYKEVARKHCQAVMTTVGSFFVVSGLLIVCFWITLFDHILFKQIALQPGTKGHEFWKDPPQPLYLDIYLFNWTNAKDFANKSIKPHFVEVGPFRFQEFPTKVNISWHDSNSTVSYRKQSRYFFIPDQSKGRLNDVITSVNVIALSAATRTRDWSWFKTKGVSLAFTAMNQNVYATKNASEWLFDGYEDQMINIAKDNPFLDAGDIPFDRFGWFYMRNDSSVLLGNFNANTGYDNIKEIGKIRKWNYEEHPSYHEGECGKLAGSAGDFFPPFIEKNQTIQLFSPEMCRSVSMDFENELEIKGVKTLKFSGGDRTVDNGSLYPENECFCGGTCVPSGVFNISSCRYGTPVFMSFPHFYKADPIYLDQIQGLTPDKEKHQFFMAFEPKTAIPLEVAARFQINILLEPIPKISMYENVQKKFMPILWFEQHVILSDSMANEVKMLLKLPSWGQTMGFLSIVLGLVLIAFVPFKQFLFNECCLKQKSSSFDDKTSNLAPPEIFPLLVEKPMECGVILIGQADKKNQT